MQKMVGEVPKLWGMIIKMTLSKSEYSDASDTKEFLVEEEGGRDWEEEEPQYHR